MSAIDKAAQVILNNGARSIRDGSAWSSPQDDDAIMEDCWDIAEALRDAGLLATEERDREVAARALREAADHLNETYRADDVLEPDVDDLSAHLLRRRADRIAGGE